MDRAAEDRSENDPEEDDGAEDRAHEGAEDRAGAGDVEKLDQKRFPGGHGDAVDTVVDGDGRRLPVVRAENLFNDAAVGQEADQKNGKGNKERDHGYILSAV